MRPSSCNRSDCPLCAAGIAARHVWVSPPCSYCGGDGTLGGRLVAREDGPAVWVKAFTCPDCNGNGKKPEAIYYAQSVTSCSTVDGFREASASLLLPDFRWYQVAAGIDVYGRSESEGCDRLDKLTCDELDEAPEPWARDLALRALRVIARPSAVRRTP